MATEKCPVEEGHRNPQRWIAMIKAITLAIVPRDEYTVFLFGSCAREKWSSYGDVDIGLLGVHPIQEKLLIALYDAIEESDVPLKVDFVDFYSVDPNFKKFALQKIVLWNRINSIKVD